MIPNLWCSGLVALLGLAGGMAAFAAGPSPAPAGVAEVTLTPRAYRDKQDNFVNPEVSNLPKLSSTRHVIYQPRDERDLTYHHGAIITHWKGRYYVAWHATQRGEDTPPYVGLVASSADLKRWTPPVRFSQPEDAAYARYMRRRFHLPESAELFVNVAPRTLHATKDRLYLWSLGWVVNRSNGNKDWVGRVSYTTDGTRWREEPPEELDRLEQEQHLSIRGTGSNHHFIPLRDGRLMAVAMEASRDQERNVLAPITRDATGLTGWSGGTLDTRQCAEVGEPAGWEGPDGVLHYAARHDLRLWHSYSRDQGKSWSPLLPEAGFSDSPGNKEFGSLPDGRVWYIGNPVPGRRDQLVLAVSQDGWRFDQSFLLRWEPVRVLYPAPAKATDHIPGYAYPSATYHHGRIAVCYSVCCDFIEVSAVDVAQLPQATKRCGD